MNLKVSKAIVITSALFALSANRALLAEEINYSPKPPSHIKEQIFSTPSPSGLKAEKTRKPQFKAKISSNDCLKFYYPINAYRNKEEGAVQLILLISKEGKVLESKLAASSGSEQLDEEARRVVSLCQFVPAKADSGQPIESWFVYNKKWNLKTDNPPYNRP